MLGYIEMPSYDIFYAFSDDLKSNENNHTKSIWNESIIPANTVAENDCICRCMILGKNKYDPSLCIIDDTHRQYPMSQILDDKNTHILSRFHMDYHKVKYIYIFFVNLFFCCKIFAFVLQNNKHKHKHKHTNKRQHITYTV